MDPFAKVTIKGSKAASAPAMMRHTSSLMTVGDDASTPHGPPGRGGTAVVHPWNVSQGLALGGGNILRRHVQIWIREDDAPGHDVPPAKELVAQLLSSTDAPEGLYCERFVKSSAARVDNDRDNPLLFIGTVKGHLARVKEMLLGDERSQMILAAAAGGAEAAAAREEMGLPVAPDTFDLPGVVHNGVEYACVRPLLGRIMRVAKQAKEDEEIFLKTKIQKLKAKSVAEYVADSTDILPARLHNGVLEGSVRTFNELAKPMLPSQVLRALQHTIRSMRQSAAEAQSTSNGLGEETVTRLLCFVIVQSAVESLRSTHLVVSELSDPVTVQPGPTTVDTATWCYRVFSNALSVIEGMTVSLSMDSHDQQLQQSSSSRDKQKQNSMWWNLTTAAQDERLPNAPTWLSDAEVAACMGCADPFGKRQRRHHCRHCGNILCDKCTTKRTKIPHLQYSKPVRVCEACFAMIELTRNPPTEQPAADSAVQQLLEGKKSKPGNAIVNYVRIFDERIKPDPATVGIKTREVMDAVRRMIMDEHRDELLGRMLKQEEDEPSWNLEYNLNLLINTILEKRYASCSF